MSATRKKNQKGTITRVAPTSNSTFTRKSQSSSDDSSKENSDTGSSTFVRPTTSGSRPDPNSESNSTFVRPTAPGGKQEEKKEDGTKTESRPTGRVDHPTTKYDYIEQLEEEEKKKQDEGQERPTGRVDHPTTKYDYIEQLGEEVQVTNVADTSDVVIEYTLKVVSPGANAEKVADVVLGAGWRNRNVNPNNPFSCTLKQNKANEAFEMARQAVALGARVEFKKRILIEVKII